MGNELGLFQQPFPFIHPGILKLPPSAGFLEHPLHRIHSESKAAVGPAHPGGRRSDSWGSEAENPAVPPRSLGGSHQRTRVALHQGPAPTSGGVQAELVAGKKKVVSISEGLKWIHFLSLLPFVQNNFPILIASKISLSQ